MLIAVGLIVGAVALALTGTGTVQSTLHIRQLQETLRRVVPYPGGTLLYTDHFSGGSCETTGYFEIYSAGTTAENLRNYYLRQFQSRGWAQNTTTGGVYPAADMRVDVIEPVPAAIGGVRIPPGVAAARVPGRVLFAVVMTGWSGELCPQLNRSTPIPGGRRTDRP